MEADELKLVEGCRKGDADARKQLYTLYAEQMLAVCYRYTGNLDDAHDVLHDGFIKIFTHFSFRGDSALKSWMYKVMSAQAIDFMRRPPSGAGSSSRVNGSLTSLRPSLPSFSEGSLRGNYRNKCRLLRTLLFHQVPARPGRPSRPRSASLGLRPARSLVQRGQGSLGGPSSAPTPRTQPCSPPARDGAPCTNGTQGGGAQEVTSLGPPPPPCSL